MTPKQILGVHHLNFQIHLAQITVSLNLLIRPLIKQKFNFNSELVKPQVSDTIEKINSNTLRIKWSISEDSIIQPIRYRITLYRKSQNEIRDWPGILQENYN